MSDSLRDQLLNAGFAELRQNSKPARKKVKHRKIQSQAAGTTSPQRAQTEPKAGYTFVPTSKPKKLKAKKPPAIKPRAGTWSSRTTPSDTETQASASVVDFAQNQKRQLMNAQIKQLIEANELKAFMGEIIYRCTLKNNLRELLVTESVSTQLNNGDLAATQLHGYTRLIPTATAADISSIDPLWPICLNTDSASFRIFDHTEIPASADSSCQTLG